MILVGENINIMSKTFGPAIKERDAKTIQKIAVEETQARVDYLDVNIGPARKEGDQTMEWMVRTIQEVVDLPLSLDTTNPLAIEAGLKVHKGQALINSVSLQPERIEQTLPLVAQYNAKMIALLWGHDGMPRDTDERAAFTAELVMYANQVGVPNEDIFVDPIVTPITSDVAQVVSCLECAGIVKEIVPGCKTLVGLSNVSSGTPDELRPVINRTYLAMLMKHNVDAAIVDSFDAELLSLARGEMPEIVDVVHRIMDGEEPHMAALTKEQAAYAKTTKVLLGRVLYSHSWLEN